MPQGKIKTKVQVPSLSKKKSNQKKKNKSIRKGARTIAPKKSRLIESAKLQKTLTAAINKNIEKAAVLEAGKSNTGLKLLEAKQFEQKNKQ